MGVGSSSGTMAKASVPKFFSMKSFAVVGASSDRTKFGNKVLRKYIDNGLVAIPVNPKEPEIEGIKVQQLADIAKGGNVDEIGISIITPPKATLNVLKEAKKLGYKNFWMQPDTAPTSAEISEIFDTKEYNVIYGGPCVLVSIDKREHLNKL